RRKPRLRELPRPGDSPPPLASQYAELRRDAVGKRDGGRPDPATISLLEYFMKFTTSLSRAFVIGSIVVAGAAGVVAQQNSVVRQPRPDALPEPAQAHPNRNQR